MKRGEHSLFFPRSLTLSRTDRMLDVSDASNTLAHEILDEGVLHLRAILLDRLRTASSRDSHERHELLIRHTGRQICNASQSVMLQGYGTSCSRPSFETIYLLIVHLSYSGCAIPSNLSSPTYSTDDHSSPFVFSLRFAFQTFPLSHNNHSIPFPLSLSSAMNE